jgi:putative transposase
LPKIGWIKLRGFRPLGGELRKVTVKRRGGHWYVAVNWRAEVADLAPSAQPAVGIDRGITTFAALSNGRNYASPAFFKRIEDKVANAQRKRSPDQRLCQLAKDKG